MPTEELLEGLLGGLTAELVDSGTPDSGELVTATIQPPLGDLDITDVLTGEVDLTFVTKDVLFTNADLEPDLTSGGLNPVTTSGQPAVTSVGNLVELPGVPGLIGQLTGNLPLSTSTSVPVRATISWEVLDDEDEEPQPLPADQYTSPTGLSGSTVSVVFAPEVTELTTAAPPAPRRRLLRATVELSANGITVGPRTLPDVPVFVPALPIPTLLALFLHTNFAARQGDDDGALLVVVPAASPLRSLSQLQSKLNALQSILDTLSGIGAFASFALGLSELVAAINAIPGAHIQFRAADELRNLNDITLIQRDWYANDTEAEDELSSLILLGPSGRGTQCSNARNHDANEGQFTVRTEAEMMAVVQNLHSTSPTVSPGAVTVDQAPGGGGFLGIGGADDFGDDLSSVRFVS